MKIVLVASMENEVEFFSELEELVSKQALGIDFEQVIVPSHDNLPAAVAKNSAGADLVLAVALFEDEEQEKEFSVIREKLVDAEISSGVLVLKCIRVSELERKDQKQEYIAELANEWSEKIIQALFKPNQSFP